MPTTLTLASWPALCIGLLVGAYWARVVRLVLKAKHTTGRGANFVPPEPLGRALRVLWYPTVALWIAHPLQAALVPLDFGPLRKIWHAPTLEWIAVATAIGAFLATLVCWKRMGKSWRMGIDPGERTALVFTGPFAYVRHPIYALSTLLMLSSFAAYPSPLMLVVALIHISFLQWEARREERHLLEVHGEPYARYLNSVGRFVPRFGK